MKDFDQMKIDDVLEPPLYPFGLKWDEIVFEDIDRVRFVLLAWIVVFITVVFVAIAVSFAYRFTR